MGLGTESDGELHEELDQKRDGELHKASWTQERETIVELMMLAFQHVLNYSPLLSSTRHSRCMDSALHSCVCSNNVSLSCYPC